MKLLLAPLAFALLLSGCTGGGGSEPVTPDQDDEGRYVVNMVGQDFDPAHIKVPVGATVVWEFVSGGSHDVTAEDGSFSSDDEVGSKLQTGMEYTHTFSEAGKTNYHCLVHHSQGMAGSVTVE